jgi:hypothetical protein
MSNATFPLGMESNNNKSYKTWKGSGIFSNPVGTTAGNIRPFTNKDYTNDTVYKQGMARPLKQYRKGSSVMILDVNNPHSYILSPREVKSSKSNTLIGQMIDRPGQTNITQIRPATASGICLTSDYMPNPSLSETPQPFSSNGAFCCNAEKNARRMVLPTSTLVKKNYYTRHEEYLKSRCLTYDQRIFNFYQETPGGNGLAKPGSASAIDNMYTANCYATICKDPSRCSLVAYKPSNPQFATQGGVSSSTRTLKLTVTEIEKNMASYRNSNGFINKNKFVACNSKC